MMKTQGRRLLVGGVMRWVLAASAYAAFQAAGGPATVCRPGRLSPESRQP